MDRQEAAILKTLIYSDLFEYPLTEIEIFTYLIGAKVQREKLQKTLEKLITLGRIKNVKGYYFLPGRERLVKLRQKRAEISRVKIKQAQTWVSYLKLNPWLKMVAITGNLAVENADEEDDIDLMLIFTQDRLFMGRFIEFVILKLLGKRRNPGSTEVKDMLCPNLYLTEDSLRIKNQDLFTAHEIVQMKPLWERKHMYQRFIEANRWINKFLPNWERERGNREARKQRNKGIFQLRLGLGRRQRLACDWLEMLARRAQFQYMKDKVSREKISDKALFFHPQDMREKILKEFKKRVEEIVG